MRKHEMTYTPPVGTAVPVLSLSAFDNEYVEDVSYDANGNILTYKRNGVAGALTMDELQYHYPTSGSKLAANRLSNVDDGVGDNAYNITPGGHATEDVDDQAPGNYGYDAIGNLTSDLKADIGTIEWTVYGKIKKIAKTDVTSTTIEYEYDPSGNRIYKKVTSGTSENYTFYVRDSQGNPLGIYTKTHDQGLQWGEQMLYGSSRLGTLRLNIAVPASANVPIGTATLADGFEYGRKSYELSNHLGNVLATISDKKVGVQRGTGITVDYFIAEVQAAQDYYPFGC